MGCEKEQQQPIDINNDGKIDFVVFKRQEHIYKTSLKRKNSDKISTEYFWDKEGKLTKSVAFSSDDTPFTFYERNHKKVMVDGQICWKSELDMNKTYKNKFIRNSSPQVYLYALNNEIILSESDKNKDGIIDSTVVFKNFQVDDEYRSPYRGIIKEF